MVEDLIDIWDIDDEIQPFFEDIYYYKSMKCILNAIHKSIPETMSTSRNIRFTD